MKGASKMIKRKPDELFYDYCARRIVEQEDQKERLKRRVIWTSAIVMPDPAESDLPEYMRSLKKVSVRGTFNRAFGHTMPNSIHEKHRRERMIRKLRRKGVISET